MSQPPRPAQESAEGPPAHSAGQTEDVAAPPRSNRWASTERRTPALEDKSKFLGCGWGVGDRVCMGRGGRRVLSTSSLGGRQPPSSSSSSPCFTPPSPQIPRSYLCSASLGLSIPLRESQRPSGPTDPTGCTPHLSARVLGIPLASPAQPPALHAL